MYPGKQRCMRVDRSQLMRMWCAQMYSELRGAVGIEDCVAIRMSDSSMPTVVIVGGGFAGLSAAKALKGAPARVLLIDRTNHHLFQPLLYQVAICTLSPAQIAAPIREILASQRNATVLMGEVVGVDKTHRLVFVNDGDR